ncbi:hypothetical protein ACSBR1_006708 [Camellia fascicularis]
MSSQQPPVPVYPNTATTTTTTSRHPSSHSNGSFGMVFIVLAIVIVISVISCFLGRLCNKRNNHNQKAHNSSPKEKEVRLPKQNHHGFHGREGDIEFGFDKGVSNGKPFGNGGGIHGEGPRFAGEG